MTSRERFLNVLNFKSPGERLPIVEWAAWWDKTIERWYGEGMPKEVDLKVADKTMQRENFYKSLEIFGLDKIYTLYAPGYSEYCPKPSYRGGPVISDEKSYEAVRPYLFNQAVVDNLKKTAMDIKEKHDRGEIAVRLWLDGFFWFPRALFGIEGHMYAFYDYPRLMHRMNNELAEFSIHATEELFSILKPDMVSFAEDMSYNHGSMLSYELFKEFLVPYYHKVIPQIKKHNIKVLVDSDGDITSMIPWMLEAGVEGVFPLERQAGVDIVKIREAYPGFLMMGGYDKMVMSKDEEAMRAEFERILPVMRSGGYIPSVDHQTPPGVSFDNYRTYVRLFRKYAQKAAVSAYEPRG